MCHQIPGCGNYQFHCVCYEGIHIENKVGLLLFGTYCLVIIWIETCDVDG